MVVAIATPLEADLVETVRSVDDRLEVLFEPDLLPPLRFPCDHRGIDGFVRTDDQERRWQGMLGRAEVLFGLPGDSGTGLAEVVRSNSGLRWVKERAVLVNRWVPLGSPKKNSIGSSSPVPAECTPVRWPNSPCSACWR